MSTSGIGNATWLELSWTLFGLGGALKYWFLVLRAAGDRRFVIAKKQNGVRRSVADMTLWTDVVLWSILVGFAIVGFVADAQPRTNQHTIYTPTALVTTVVFFYGSIAINVIGVLRQRWRNHIYEIEAEHEAAREHAEQAAIWNGDERRNGEEGVSDVPA